MRLLILVYFLIIKLINCNTEVEVEVIPALLIHEEHQYLYPNDPRLQNGQDVNNKPSRVNTPRQPQQTNNRIQTRPPSPTRNNIRPLNSRQPSNPPRNNVRPLNARPPSSGLKPPPPAAQRPPPRMNKRVQNIRNEQPSRNRIQSRPTTPKSAYHPIDSRKPVGLKPPQPSQTVNRGPNYNVNRRKNKNMRNGQRNPGIKNDFKPIVVQPLQNIDPINILPPSKNQYLPLQDMNIPINLPIQQNQYLPSRPTQNRNRNRINLGNVASSGQSQYLPSGQLQNNNQINIQNQYLPNNPTQNTNRINNDPLGQNPSRPVQNRNQPLSGLNNEPLYPYLPNNPSRNRINTANEAPRDDQNLNRPVQNSNRNRPSGQNSNRPTQNLPSEDRRYLPNKKPMQENPEPIGVTALHNALVTVQYEMEANRKTNGPSTYKTFDVNSRITEDPPTRIGRRRGNTRIPEYDYEGVTRPLRRQESNIPRVKFRQSNRNGANRKNPPRVISSESFQLQNYPRNSYI